MIKIIPRCEKCKNSMRDEILSDRAEDTFTQFHVCYCPYCIELGDEIPVRVVGMTIKSTKTSLKGGHEKK